MLIFESELTVEPDELDSNNNPAAVKALDTNVCEGSESSPCRWMLIQRVQIVIFVRLFRILASSAISAQIQTLEHLPALLAVVRPVHTGSVWWLRTGAG